MSDKLITYLIKSTAKTKNVSKMKKLKKLKLNDAVSISETEMKSIKGGISRDEYCKTLSYLWEHNADSWSPGTVEGWWYGWSTYCQ